MWVAGGAWGGAGLGLVLVSPGLRSKGMARRQLRRAVRVFRAKGGGGGCAGCSGLRVVVVAVRVLRAKGGGGGCAGWRWWLCGCRAKGGGGGCAGCSGLRVVVVAVRVFRAKGGGGGCAGCSGLRVVVVAVRVLRAKVVAVQVLRAAPSPPTSRAACGETREGVARAAPTGGAGRRRWPDGGAPGQMSMRTCAERRAEGGRE
eukprot:scaffold25956_cov78-Isochrysis_galbana.AAC.1